MPEKNDEPKDLNLEVKKMFAAEAAFQAYLDALTPVQEKKLFRGMISMKEYIETRKSIDPDPLNTVNNMLQKMEADLKLTAELAKTNQGPQ